MSERVEPTKLKGRARKLAQEAAAGGQPSDASQLVVSTNVVKTKDFVPMAQHIADVKDKKVIIPIGILRVFNRCITARTDVGLWYEATGIPDLHGGHAAFVDVLKQVLQYLVPLEKLEELDRLDFSLSRPHNTNASSTILEDANRYANPDLQDIDEAVLETTANVQSSTWSHGTPTFDAELEDTTSEWLFALDCLFQYMNELQRVIGDRWDNYSRGLVDLTLVAVLTNEATSLVRQAEANFRKVSAPEQVRRASDQSLPFQYFVSRCTSDGLGRKDMVLTSSQHLVPYGAWNRPKRAICC